MQRPVESCWCWHVAFWLSRWNLQNILRVHPWVVVDQVPMPFPMKAFLMGGSWSPRRAPDLPSALESSGRDQELKVGLATKGSLQPVGA